MLKLSFRQQVLWGFVISLLLVFGIFYFSYNSINDLHKNQELVEQSENVIKTATSVRSLLVDGETGQRGYIASQKETFLQPYTGSISKIPPALGRLKALVAGNADQSKRVDSVARYADLKIQELKSIILIARTNSFEAARAALAGDPGKFDMDQVRLWIGRIVDEENNLLKIRKASSDSAETKSVQAIIIGGIVVGCMVLMLFSYIQRSFKRVKSSEEQTRVANLELEKVLDENTAKNWLLTGTSLLNEKMQGEQGEKALAANILNEICRYSHALAGTLYLFNEATETLELYASYAVNNHESLKKSIKLSEGWLGQAAENKTPAIIKSKLNDKFALATSLVYQELAESFVVPFFFEKKLKGVLETAFNDKLTTSVEEYILRAAENIGIAINTAQARTIMHDLLLQVQQQAEELEAQQEEMRVTNDELLTNTERLQESEEELRSQQEELRTANAELEEKAALLGEKNKVIEEAHRAIDIKIKELETTGRYRSEFLANMSHELRTPLNSILVLAQILKENKQANLSEEQLKYAGVIFNAGNDLLTLISDILDLAKIESGKLEVQNETIKIAGILKDMEMLFAEVAAGKKIKFTVKLDKSLPQTMLIDTLRVEQILKNLLSNAFKFTPENGYVSISAEPAGDGNSVSFRIKDSGIGIAEDKQKIIFEAFQQADGSTSRKYGGTGLGLSISRGLVELIGGDITLTSKAGAGSEFVLTVPLMPGAAFSQKESDEHETGAGVHDFPDTQTVTVEKREPVIIIFEDDKNFAHILHDYALQHGFKSIIVNEGTDAVEIIKKNLPDAVILDIMLPGKDGWQILKELKQDKTTMHIPVHLMSAGGAATNRVRHEGAISFLKKPVGKATLDKLFNDVLPKNRAKVGQHILLVEDSKAQSQGLEAMAQSKGIVVDRAFDGASALKMLGEKEYQCVVLDLSLPDISGPDLLNKIKAIDRFSSLPVIINSSTELNKESLSKLMQYANAMVVRSSSSPDRLMDEVDLFLNKVAGPGGKGSLANSGKNILKGKRILLVDDDVRNVFALSSALQGYDMIVEIAGNGREAIDKLEKMDDISMVLMDVMMPVMDGYEAIRHIRQHNKWQKLPVLALTAKTMNDDHEKCIAAGANDYIDKPIDISKLISLMQMWLEH